MRLASCIYRGRVRHRRFAPLSHRFRYSLFMLYLDLDELDQVFRRRWLWSARRPAPCRFRREDHYGDPATGLAESIRDLVEERAGVRPRGSIRLLTHLRYFGFCFNPVSVYYCFDPAGRQIEAIVAEVHNTPWGERHCYVFTPDSSPEGRHRLRFRIAKEFHVSPFMGMDLTHDFRFAVPGQNLWVHIENRKADSLLFDATLTLRRREISGRSLAGALTRFPWMTLQVVVAIYVQALRLWVKRFPFHPHPATADSGRNDS